MAQSGCVEKETKSCPRGRKSGKKFAYPTVYGGVGVEKIWNKLKNKDERFDGGC